MELAEWMAYSIIEPFGAPAAFHRTGLVASMLHNVNRAKDSDAIATPTDFMPGPQAWEDQDDATGNEQLLDRIRSSFRTVEKVNAHEPH